ncbi:MAG: ABC transporter ATP-binding protein [Bacteroidales bacterium]|nr:ABC transporter ATP-binding protein [Bacteroidales bacterium]
MSTTNPPPLQVEEVAKRFRQGGEAVDALAGVSLRVTSGELVAVMGMSGSGKSTLLHVIAGLTRTDSGRVLVEGEELATMSDSRLTGFRRRRIGLVFQSFNLVPSLTAEDNVLLPLYGQGGTADPAKLDTLFHRLGIASRRHHRPDAMSGGEQQRVAIARALITDPALVLADEPTGSLDSVTGQKLCALLRELCDEQKRTIIVVTHEAAVAAWADRVIVMKDGRILTEFAKTDFTDSQALAAMYHEAVTTTKAVAS